VSRIVVELVYATVEMLFDEPLDATAVARTVAGMIASHLGKVRPGGEEPEPVRKKTGRRG
jgi:hypothetical protein